MPIEESAMAYHLTLANNPNNIAESEYGAGPQVRFSPITSCILIAGETAGGAVGGVHLVMVQDEEPFGAADVPVVTGALESLQVSPPTVIVFGQTNMWEDNVQAGYQALLQALGLPPTTDLNDGTYGAKLVDGTVIYFNAAEPIGEGGGLRKRRSPSRAGRGAFVRSG
jgi:hypothetical protein